MAIKPTTTTTTGKPTWSPGAWTPMRCRIWNLREGADRDAFSAWVSAEAKANDGGCYDHQLRPEDQALLEQHQQQQAAAEAA